jgi:hypothetical protein
MFTEDDGEERDEACSLKRDKRLARDESLVLDPEQRPVEGAPGWERTPTTRSGHSTPPDTNVLHLKELIEDETHVDLDKLAESARAGLPMAVRGDVWRYLLGVAKADKSEEFTHERELHAAYKAVRCAAVAALVNDGQATDNEYSGASSSGDTIGTTDVAVTTLTDESGLSREPGSDTRRVRTNLLDNVILPSFAGIGGERYATGRNSFECMLSRRPEQTRSDGGSEPRSNLSLDQSSNWDGSLARRVRNEAKRRIERERLRKEQIRWRQEKRASSVKYGQSPSSRNISREMMSMNIAGHHAGMLRNVDHEARLMNPQVIQGELGLGGLSDGEDALRVPSRPPSTPAYASTLERPALRQLEREDGILCSSPESVSSGTNSFRSGESSGPRIHGTSNARISRDDAPGAPVPDQMTDYDAAAHGKRPDRHHEGNPMQSGDVGRLALSSARTLSTVMIQCYVNVLCTYLYAVEVSVRHMIAWPMMAHWNAQLSPTTDNEETNGSLTSLEAPLEYSPTMVSLLHVFVEVFTPAREMDIYYAFCALMHRLGQISLFTTRGDGLSRATANFLMLFRTLLPDLADFFESEEIEHRRWLHGWLQGLFSRGEMPTENTMRLWDFYFASGLEMHTYVCLAVLDFLQEEITEMDGPEVVTFLGKLPDNLDPEQLLTRAVTIRETALGSGLISSASRSAPSAEVEKGRRAISTCFTNED